MIWRARGSWGVFNVSELAQCVDYAMPMAYCSPESKGGIAGPTLPLDSFKAMVAAPTTKRAGGWLAVPPSKMMVGLPAFGYAIPCTNPRPSGFPKNNSCVMARPLAYPKVTFAQAMALWRKEQVTSGSAILYDNVQASAWFEFTNSSNGQRYQGEAPFVVSRWCLAGLFSDDSLMVTQSGSTTIAPSRRRRAGCGRVDTEGSRSGLRTASTTGQAERTRPRPGRCGRRRGCQFE